MIIEPDNESTTIVKEKIIKRIKQENLAHQYNIYSPKQMRLYDTNGLEYLDYDNFSNLHYNDMLFFASNCKRIKALFIKVMDFINKFRHSYINLG
jgi:hypothetical protein